jgi:catechol 2,3-dioxygenase-like lactoylglutathione lyase family enzyme
MQLDHINIAAPPALLDRVRDFYRDALQLEEGARPDFGVPGYWLYGGGKPIVHLIESEQHHTSDARPYLDHVAFRGEDAAGLAARLQRLGVEYTVNHIESFNLSQVFCRDPAGTGVEVNFFGEAPP